MTKFKGRGTVQITGRNAGKNHWTNVAIKRLMEDLASQPISNLLLSEGKVYGARYYCIEPVGGNWWEMECWCFNAFGDCGDKSKIWGEVAAPNPAERWYMNNRKFWFRDEKDRTMFILKWA